MIQFQQNFQMKQLKDYRAFKGPNFGLLTKKI